jgi:hypothetical protein
MNAKIETRFKVGQLVTVDSSHSGDYHGIVVKTHEALTIYGDYMGTGYPRSRPGVTVKVTRWDGIDYEGHDAFEILAHDRNTRCQNGPLTTFSRFEWTTFGRRARDGAPCPASST